MSHKGLTRGQLMLKMVQAQNNNNNIASNISNENSSEVITEYKNVIEEASRHNLILVDFNDSPGENTNNNQENVFIELVPVNFDNVEENTVEETQVSQETAAAQSPMSTTKALTSKILENKEFYRSAEKEQVEIEGLINIPTESSEILKEILVPGNDQTISENDQTIVTVVTTEDTFRGENITIEEEVVEDGGIEGTARQDNFDNTDGEIDPMSSVSYTSKRNIKKRKHKKNRQEMAKLKSINKHPIREPCKDKCRKQCTKLISEDQRNSIHKNYWSLSWIDQRKFILNTCSRMPVKRRTLSETTQRNMTYCYRLADTNGKKVDVCKTFFLTTLGYNLKNDKVIFNVLHKTKPGTIIPEKDRRGKNPPPNKIDREALLAHVESFHPNISHYRREHAPHVKYLPSDVTIALMHKDFLQKYPQFKCSYEAYRKILFAENIRFTKLGHEECETCEVMRMHNKDHDEEHINPDCDTCKKWTDHIKKAKVARQLYQKHANTEYDPKTVCVSADLEKIIMLPRMENFKKVLFTPRLVAYNETFVPLGTKEKKVLPVAVLWHEGLRGRGKEELISTFFQFLLQYRDVENFIFWLDNCAAQNKNWAFMTFLVYIVNSAKVAAKSIEVYYFEPGHTFMSADSLHHQIELSLKHKKKVCDFDDFAKVVQLSNKQRIVTKVMNINDFYDFQDLSSIHKRNNANRHEKVFLSDIVNVRAIRGSFELEYKLDLENNETKKLNFLKHTVFKAQRIPDPVPHNTPCGIPQEKKSSIVANLLNLMDENRKEFWLNLPVKN